VKNLWAFAKRLAGHSTAQNAALLYLVQIGTYVFPLLTLPYLGRVLGVERLGLLVSGQTFIWYFYTLTEYGFDLTATRRVAIHKEDPQELSRIFSSVMVSKALLTLGGFVIMVTAVFLTPKLSAHWELYLLSFLTVLGGLFFPMWLYQGMEKMKLVAIRDFSAKLVAMVLIFLVVKRQTDYLWATVFPSGAMAAAGLLSLLMAPHICGVRFIMPNWKQVWAELQDGWAVFLSMAALSLTGTNLVILGFIGTEKQVGYYSGAFRIVIALRSIAVPLVAALYPYVSHRASKSTADTIRFLKKYAFLPALPFLAGSILVFVMAPFFVKLILGPEFGPSAPLLRIMAFSPFLLVLSNVYSTYFLLAFGFSKQWSQIVWQSTVLNYVLIGSLIWIMPADYAMAVTMTILDTYVVVAAYLIYRKQAPRLMAESGPTPATTLA
jgi:PST family polysaccharide transporter